MKKKRHYGDCPIYALLINDMPECGICCCGYGWELVGEVIGLKCILKNSRKKCLEERPWGTEG